MSNNLKALLLWRGTPLTKENIKNVDKNEYYCIYPAFADFTILRKKEDISKYREIYEEKTGKTWKTATLQEIFKSEMVW
jgi:hypothetical protein